MTQDLISAAGARLEALLQAQDTRGRSIRTTSSQPISTAVPFVLPDGTNQFPYEPTGPAASDIPNVTPPVSAESGVGATFRRKGVLSDVPMTVTRVGEGVVFTAFTGDDGPQEMEFAAEQIDVVTKAPSSSSFAEVSFYQSPMAMMEPAGLATASVRARANAPANSPVGSPPIAPATLTPTPNAAVVAPAFTLPVGDTAPIPSVLLSDGTKQFGNAPSAATHISRVPNVTPPVPPEFGIGATFRRLGVTADIPMTVTRVGDGVVFANFTDSDGVTYDAAFHPNQLNLVAAAP